MSESKKSQTGTKTEFEYPETLFVRDIDNRVFQHLVAKVIASSSGVSLAEATLMDNILHIAKPDGISGVAVTQDSKNHSVAVRLEINVAYGISIPEKSEEVQMRVAEEITRYTGLHVSGVHLVVRDILLPEGEKPPFSSPRASEGGAQKKGEKKG